MVAFTSRAKALPSVQTNCLHFSIHPNAPAKAVLPCLLTGLWIFYCMINKLTQFIKNKIANNYITYCS